SRSGRRPGKEVVVEPDNNEKYVDVNDELSDDDFVNSSYGSSKKALHGRLDNGLNCDRIHYCLIKVCLVRLRRSGRKKDQEVYDSDNVKTVASGSKGKGEIQVRKRLREAIMPIGEKKTDSGKIAGNMLGIKNEGADILEGNPNRDDEMVRNWKQQYGDAKEITTADLKMRMRKSKEADLNFKLNFIVLFTSIMGNIRQKGRALKTCKKGWKQGKKDSYFRGPLIVLTMRYVDGTKCNDNIVYRRRPPTKVWTAELLSERDVVELNCGGFGHGELEEDFIDEEGDPIPNNIEGCIWMLNNYVKNITKEQKGFEKMLSAAEHMFPGNVNLIGFADKYMNNLKCSSEGNNLSTNATMPDTQEKEKDVQGEAGYPNMNRVEVLNEEVEVLDGDIGVNKQTPSSGKNLMGLTKKCVGQDADVGQDVDVGQDACSLFGFDRQENMCGLLTQKAFESIADEVELSIEKSKSMEIDDRPSFSFGMTQDFDVIAVTKNENKVLTPMPISVYKLGFKASDVFMFHGKRVTTKSNIIRSPLYSRVVDAALSSEESKVAKYLNLTNHESNTDILFKSKSGQQSNRLQMESLGQDYVETNILDTWAVVCNFMEEYRSNDSPFRLFLPTFVVDKDSFSQSWNDNGRFERVLQHVESVTKSTSELNKLKKIDLVFLPVDNEGHRFLLTFDLKYGAVTMFDQKKKDKIVKKNKHKKGAKIGNSIVAKMLVDAVFLDHKC
nr:major facilitator superfamily domain, general substrate transporter [Tanacetum cinerariifolium]